jgi:hypothetical protein
LDARNVEGCEALAAHVVLQSDDDDFLEVALLLATFDFLRQDSDVAAVTNRKVGDVERI